MAFLYGLARDAILKQTLNVFGGNLCATLVSISGGSPGTTNYVVNQNSDQHFNIIPGYATTGSGSVLSGGSDMPITFASQGTLSSTLGALFFSSKFTFPSVTNTLPAGAVVLWVNSGTASTSSLVCYIDYPAWVPPNAIAPNGNSINFVFNSASPGIFML
jgi:hypothetical protein